MTTAPLVSIIIRARNEQHALERLLPLLQRQETDFSFEIWLLDNESTDNTAALALQFGLCYYVIPRDAFNYATSLNLGAALARGEIIVNLSAHCFPQSTRWLATLVAPLRADPQVVATYGSQRTDPRFNPFEAQGSETTYPLRGVPPFVAFSNSNGAMRREAVRCHPFNPEVRALEDHLWYLELRGDFAFVYVPEALVLHEQDGLTRGGLRRWELQGRSLFFIGSYRGLASPLVPDRIIAPGHLLRYLRGTIGFLLRGQFKAALLMIPTHVARDLMWLKGWLKALRGIRATIRADAALQTQINRPLLKERLSGQPAPRHAWQLPYDWPEEWQLRGNWTFIRENTAQFIRQCHEQGLISSPLLEVGASGQNDYLREFYTMQTSNLDYNRQGSDQPLDMENMYAIPNDSLGTILCSEVLEHVYHPDRAVSEAWRVLRPGGTLVVSVPYNIVIHNSEADGGFHGRNFTPQGIELILREAGFDIALLETRGESDVRREQMPSNIFIVGRKPLAEPHSDTL